MPDLKQMSQDKSHARGVIVIIAILMEAIGVSLAAVSFLMIPVAHQSVHLSEGSGAVVVVLIAIVILFAAAAYFTGRLYGKSGIMAVFAGFMVIVIALLGLSFSYVL